MPIPAAVCKVVFHGTLPGGEIWETGFWMNDTGVTSSSLAAALADIVTNTATANDGSGAMRIFAAALWGAGISWTETRVYAYVTGGRVADYVGLYTLPVPLTGAGNGTLPNQCALVLTLRSGLSGRSYRGRMYLPLNQAGLDASGNLQVEAITPLVNAFGTYFTDINQSATGQIVIVSATRGAATPLASVSMDTRLDIQRRRANQQTITGSHSAAVAAHTG